MRLRDNVEKEDYKILVVDDEALIRGVIKEYLTLEGYTVDEAIDGTDAVEKYKEIKQQQAIKEQEKLELYAKNRLPQRKFPCGSLLCFL